MKDDLVPEILNQIDRAIIILNEDQSLDFANQKALHIFGLSSEDTIDKKCFEILNHNNQQCSQCAICSLTLDRTETESLVEYNKKSYTVKAKLIHQHAKNYILLQFIERKGSRLELETSPASTSSFVPPEIEHDEHYLNSIFRAAPVGIGVVVNRILHFVNARISEITGYTVAELLGKSARLFYTTEEEFIRVGKEKYSAISEKGTGTIETQWKCKDGSIKEILLSSTPIDESNLLRGVTFTALDITQRKEAEQRYARSQELHKNFLNSAADAIFIADAETGKILDANQKALELIGRNHDEVLKMTQNQLHPAELSDETSQRFRGVTNFETTLDQIDIIHKSGKRIPVEINPSIHTGVNGEKLIMGVFRDISARNEYQRQVHLSEERYRRLIEVSPGLILVIHKNKFLFANPQALKVLGYKSFEELEKMEAHLLIHKDDVLKFKESILQSHQSVSFDSIEERWLKKNSTVMNVQCTSIPIHYNNVEAMLVMGIDVTSKKEAETLATSVRDAISTIQMGIASQMGSGFFETIVTQLAKALGADFTFVGELKGENETLKVETISFLKKGKIAGNFSYSLEYTPCKEVINSHLCSYRENVAKLFPKDKLLKEMEIEGYSGIVLKDSKNNVSGILVAMFQQPMLNEDFAKSILEIFSVRTGAEIERRNSELDLERANELFRTIAQNIPDIILRVDPKLYCTYVSPNVEEYAGILGNDFIGKKLDEQQELDPEFTTNRQKNFNQVIKSKKAIQSVISANTTKGNRILEWRMIPEFDQKGNVISVLSLIRDITKAQETEAELNKLFNLSADMICIATIRGQFLKINPSFEKVLGYTEHELLTNPYFELIHPNDIEATNQIIESRLEKGETVINLENRFKCKNGAYKWLSWMIQPFGRDDKVFAIARDITLHRSTMRELIQAKEKAEESDKLKSTFLANMSHEIRTPMNAIMGFASLLQRPDLPVEKQKHFSEIIKDRSEDLLGIIDDILDISKIEAGQINIVNEAFSNSELSRELQELFEHKISEEKQGKLTLEFGSDDSDPHEKIIGDGLRVKQVLTNLIDNAIKFTPGGTVKFGYSIKDSKVVYKVTDTGIGIPVHKQKNIFKRFRQAEESTTRNYGGNGLGLAICKALVQLMKGKLWLESIEGKGSSFYFEIPYIPLKVNESDLKYSLPKEEIELENTRILIVEDDAYSREFLRLAIAQTKAETEFAASGGEALVIFESDPNFDLIMMDIQLPDIDGYEVTRRIRKTNKKIPILAQTAFAMAEDSSKSFEAGCTEYLSKPVKVDVLIETIWRLIRNKSEDQSGMTKE